MPLTQQVTDYIQGGDASVIGSTQQFHNIEASQGFIPFQDEVSNDSTLGLVDNILADMKGRQRMSQRMSRLSLKRLIRPNQVS